MKFCRIKLKLETPLSILLEYLFILGLNLEPCPVLFNSLKEARSNLNK